MVPATLTDSGGRQKWQLPSGWLVVIAALAALSGVWIASSVVDDGDATCGRVVAPQSNSPDGCTDKLGVLLLSVIALSVATGGAIAVAFRVSDPRVRIGMLATTTVLVLATLITVESLRSGGVLKQ